MNWLTTFIKTSADAVNSAAGEASAVVESSGVVDEVTGTPSFLEKYGMIIMLVVFALIFYFLMIRPEKKRKKKAQEERDALKVGDTVISIGGITGEIEEIKKDTVVIFTGDGSIDLQKWAIRTVQPNTDGKEDEEVAEGAEEAAESNESETKEEK